MKLVIYVFIIFCSANLIAEEFRFKPQALEDFESFEDEVVIIGGVKIKRSELVISNVTENDIFGEDVDKYFRSDVGKVTLNSSLIAATTYTLFKADKDKQMHAMIGALAGYGTSKLCKKFLKINSRDLICALSGAGAALLLGLAKEAYDSTGRGNVDFMDAVYTFVPGALISFKVSY